MKKFVSATVLAAAILMGAVLAYNIWKARPQTSQAYFESGKSYYDQKKYQEAIIQFLNAIQKDDRNRDARYLMALSFINQQDFNQAAMQLRALLELYPDDIPANLELGNLYLRAAQTNPDFF